MPVSFFETLFTVSNVPSYANDIATLFGRFSQPRFFANFNKAVSVFLPIVNTAAPLSGFPSSNAVELTETEMLNSVPN